MEPIAPRGEDHSGEKVEAFYDKDGNLQAKRHERVEGRTSDIPTGSSVITGVRDGRYGSSKALGAAEASDVVNVAGFGEMKLETALATGILVKSGEGYIAGPAHSNGSASADGREG